MGKVQSNTTCNVYITKRFLHSLSQQLHVSAFIQAIIRLNTCVLQGKLYNVFVFVNEISCTSIKFPIKVSTEVELQPCGLRRRSTAACLLRSWVRISLEAWMFVCCECCVLSGNGLCDGLITRPEESYRLWRVVVCDQETSYARRLQPHQRAVKYNPQWGLQRQEKKKQEN